ncbi:MAG TPA: WYL domain-containing protein, partial [Acidimicrobiales bacterium]|nr:WYL domain-containing protein [Acidimicrobiales bacterium]
VGWCRALLGNRVRIGPGAPDGRVEIELRGHSVRSLVAEIGGFGSYLEVVSPPEVRQELLVLATELTRLYQVPSPGFCRD